MALLAASLCRGLAPTRHTSRVTSHCRYHRVVVYFGIAGVLFNDSGRPLKFNKQVQCRLAECQKFRFDPILHPRGYNLRGRTPKADVDVCFNGNIAASQVELLWN